MMQTLNDILDGFQMYKTSGLLTACYALIFASVVNSAELLPKGAKEGGIVISLRGEIKTGDDAQLEASLEKAKNLGLRVNSIELDSPGGLVFTSTSMAKLVRSNKLNTVVADGATCASACFMIFAAGSVRFAGTKARIGVHSAVNPGVGENDGAKSTTIDMARFLSELGVPSLILGRLVTSRPQEMAWLTPEDLLLMRINTAIAPNSRESYIEKIAPAIRKISPNASPENRRKADYLLTQGFSYIRSGRPQEALPILKQASQYNPYSPDIASSYGYALHLSGNNEDAKGALMLALQLKPDFSETHRLMALTVASLDDEQWAKECLLNYYKYSSYKDLALDAIRIMRDARASPSALVIASKEAIQIISAR